MSVQTNASETLAQLFGDLMRKATTDNPPNLIEYAASYFTQLLDEQRFEGCGQKDYNGNAQFSKFANSIALQIQRNDSSDSRALQKRHSTDNQCNGRPDFSQSIAASFFGKEISDQGGPRKNPTHKTMVIAGNTKQKFTLPTAPLCFEKARFDHDRYQQRTFHPQRSTDVSSNYQMVPDAESIHETNICDEGNSYPSKLPPVGSSTADCAIKTEVKTEPRENVEADGSRENVEVKMEPCFREDYITPDEHHQYRDSTSPREEHASNETRTDAVPVHEAIDLLPIISNTRDQLPNSPVRCQLQRSSEEKETDSVARVNIDRLSLISGPDASISNEVELYTSKEKVQSSQSEIESRGGPRDKKNYKGGESRSFLENECTLRAGDYAILSTQELEAASSCGANESLKGRIVKKWKAKMLENQPKITQPEKRMREDATLDNPFVGNLDEERNANFTGLSVSPRSEEPAADFCHKKLNYHGKRRKKFAALLGDVSSEDAVNKLESAYIANADGLAHRSDEETSSKKSSEAKSLISQAKYKHNNVCHRKHVSENVTFGNKILKCRNNLEVTLNSSCKFNKGKRKKGVNLEKQKKGKLVKGRQSLIAKTITSFAAGILVRSKEKAQNSGKTDDCAVSSNAVRSKLHVAVELLKEREDSLNVKDTELGDISAGAGSGIKDSVVDLGGRKKAEEVKNTVQETKSLNNEVNDSFQNNCQEHEKEVKSKRERKLVRYGDDDDDDWDDVGGDDDTDDYSDEAPFDCTECGKALKTEEQLIKHQKSHTSKKPMKCKTCGKGFKMYGNLWKHERTHSGIKPYKCEICNKAFIVPSKLSRHMRVHTGERPYRCKICSKSFMQGNDLVRHELIHSGQKPFVCSACGKTFALCGNLKQHEVTHTGDRRHKCSMCDKMFGTSVERRKHERTHSKTKDFKCNGCMKAFKSPEYLRKHIKKMHASP